MGEGEENIISGPEPKFQVPNYTLGQVILMKLKTQPPDNVLQIDSDTGRSVTSPEFLLLSLQVAEGLKELGIQPGDVVCLIGQNGIDISVAAAGTLFQGGIVCPTDPSLKSFEYQHIFKVSEPKFIFCDVEVIEEVTDALNQMESSTPVIVIGDEDGTTSLTRFEDFLKEPDLSSFQPVGSEDNKASVAFLVFSSGTTGLPKGVLLSDFGLIYQLLTWQSQCEDRGLGKMTFLHTSHFFWISGVLMYNNCICGGVTRIAVRPLGEVSIMQAIQEYKPLWCFLAPSHLKALMDHPDFKTYDLSSIMIILTGGSALQQVIVDRLKEEWKPNMMCTQGYGCTEITGVATAMHPGDDASTVGHLVSGVQLKVVDLVDGHLLGPGETGELYLKTPSAMLGYVNNEEATKEAFDEDGWIRSGDTGYYDETGRVFISGRIKEFIKYKNLQIAPAELEHLIMTVPGVSDVGIAGICIDPDTYYPMALVVKQEGSEITEEDITKCVNENMSEYKQLRGGVCFVEDIPRTPTGKIKRTALQQLAKTLYMDD